MSLQSFWFVALAAMWAVFLFLEGFDFGVGMLHDFVGRAEDEKRVAINAIGPVWDGNEVWLIVAGAGTFAAFPQWYATMFSGFYIALVLALAALIIRGVSFEFRSQSLNSRARRIWDGTLTLGSFLVPLLIGVALANLLRGTPIASDREFTGNFVDLLNAYSLFVGVTIVLLCLVHGATFLGLKTDGAVRERAHGLARWLSLLAALAVVAYGVWTIVMSGQAARAWVPIVAMAGAAAAVVLVWRRREGLAFVATSVAMIASVATIFVELYPRVMVSSTSTANDLTISNASSASYSLTVMTVVAGIFLPLIIIYQGWVYYVFRRRVGKPGGRQGAGGGESPDTGEGAGGESTGTAGAYTGG